jgi:glycosyltransferase involved in cell wall biosynthesis
MVGRPAASPETVPSVSLFGDLSKLTGTGYAARGTRDALRAAGVQVTEFDLGNSRSWEAPDPASVNLVHANPNRLGQGLDAQQLLRFLGDRPTIGYWVWETDGVPETWIRWLPTIDELWVPSNFVAAAVAPFVEVPVVVIPHPVDPPAPQGTRADFGLPEDTFIFLFTFDAASLLARKNPRGLFQAYKTAFRQETGETLLLVKTKRAAPSQLSRLKEAADGRTDIVVMDAALEQSHFSGLIAQCDCYVSLHRAEGFGLTIAEAMFFGKPVIATGYSGNMDFMDEESAFPVDYELGELEADRGPFPAGSTFAYADTDHAAQLMRQVIAEPEQAKRREQLAATRIRTELSPAAVGARMRAQLGSVRQL